MVLLLQVAIVVCSLRPNRNVMYCGLVRCGFKIEPLAGVI